MSRYSQTIARIASGYSVLAALVWLLWPESMAFADNPEAWFVFATALVAWHATELKQSEEIRPSSAKKSDEKFAQRLIKLHQGELRYLLCDQNLWNYIDVEVYYSMRQLIDDFDNGRIFFSHKKIQSQLREFVAALSELSLKVAQDTTPVRVGGALRIGYKPERIVQQDEYDRLMKESRVADRMADNAWVRFEKLVVSIREFVPDAYFDGSDP